MDNIGIGLQADGSVGRSAEAVTGIAFKNTYKFEAHDKDGNLLWSEEVNNLVTVEGCNDNLTQYFKGSTYTAAFFIGLIDNANFSAVAGTDTAAKITTTAPSGGTNGWQESSAYSETVRQTLTLGTASAGSIDNTASKAVFTANTTVTINGAFLATSSTKGGTSGKLFGEASFSGTKALTSSDTLTVTVTLTAITV